MGHTAGVGSPTHTFIRTEPTPMRPLLRGFAAAVTLSLAPLAAVTTTASPAQAAVVVNTRTTFDPDIRKVGEYGTFVSISGAVQTTDDPDGYSSPFEGVAQLQRKAPGSKTWKTIASDDSPGFAYFPSYDTYRSNTQLRIYFTGGTYNPGASNERVYPPSVSKPITLKVFRELEPKDVSKRQPTVAVKISPKYAKKPILVQKKKGKGWKTFKKVRTNKKSRARIAVKGSRQGIPYRLVVPGNKQFLPTQYQFRGVYYRSSSRTSVGS